MKLFKTIFFIIICMGMIWSGAFGHENVHQIAFEKDDISSEMNFNLGFPVSVTAERGCKTEACDLINGFNEVVEYNLVPFYAAILFGLGIIIFILDNRDERWF